jgi:hypothetical protein
LRRDETQLLFDISTAGGFAAKKQAHHIYST